MRCFLFGCGWFHLLLYPPSICAPADDRISFLLCLILFHRVYLCHIFSIHTSIDGHLGWVHTLGTLSAVFLPHSAYACLFFFISHSVALTHTLAYSIECSPFLHSLTSTCYLPTYILLHNRENRNVQVKCLTTGVQPVSTFRGAFHSNVASHGENTASKECFLHIPLPHAVYVTQIPIHKTSLIYWDI